MKDLSANIFQASIQLSSGSSETYQSIMPKILQLLLGPVESFPFAQGVSDALYLLGIVEREVGLFHQAEVFNLLAWRMRASLIDKKLKPNILINLAQACLAQKSFEEAYQYSQIAEIYTDSNDSDLLAIQAVSTAMTKRDDKAKTLFTNLQTISPEHYSTARQLLNGTGFLKPTCQVQCKSLATKFADYIQSFRKPSIFFPRKRKPAHDIGELTQELLQAPDGVDAWKCWEHLLKIYLSGSLIKQSDDAACQYKALEATASTVACCGKIIAFHPNHARDDGVIWLQYAQGLGQLCFFDLAQKFITKALQFNLEPRAAAACRDGLQYIRHMNSLPEQSPQRPDSIAALNTNRQLFYN